MVFGLPTPVSSMDAFQKGFGFDAGLMKEILARKQLSQQMKIHQDDLAMRKAAAARAGANSDLNRMILQERLKSLHNQNDPMYEINNLKQMMAAFGGGEKKLPTEQESYIPSIGGMGDTSQPMPSLNLDSSIPSAPNMPSISYSPDSFIPSYNDPTVTQQEDKPQQLESFIQQALSQNNAPSGSIPQMNEQAVSPYEAAQSGQGGLDMETIKNSPILRGWFKKKFGFDPGAPTPQTPEEKLNNQIRLHQENRAFDIAHPTAAKETALHGEARDAADLERLKKEAGENSEVYQNAKAQYDAKLDAKKDLRDLRARTKAGLKVGEKEFFDQETGEPLGKEIPLTEKERDAEQGNTLFNELYPHVYKGAAPFSGEGSIGRLEQAAANYKTNPQAQQLFDDFLLAEKMLAATTVNEAATLKAGKTNRTYGMLKESLEAQDVPEKIKSLIKQFQIPASAQLKAAMRYQKLLSDARIKAKKSTPATQRLYYNPELQAKHEAEQEEGKPVNHSTQSVIIIDPSGKKFKTSEENAAHLPAGWKRG